MLSLSNAMQTLVDGIRISTDARHMGLHATREGTLRDLVGYGRRRRDMAGATRRSVRKQVTEIREAVSEIRRSTREFLGEIASDIRAGTQLWRGGPQPAKPSLRAPAVPPRRGLRQRFPTAGGAVAETAADVPISTAGAPAAPARDAPPCEPDAGAEDLTQRAQVLRVIQAHPDGIRLVDIGNQLGVDWRGLIGLTKGLLDEGKIEKIEHLYYPSQN